MFSSLPRKSYTNNAFLFVIEGKIGGVWKIGTRVFLVISVLHLDSISSKGLQSKHHKKESKDVPGFRLHLTPPHLRTSETPELSTPSVTPGSIIRRYSHLLNLEVGEHGTPKVLG